MWFSKILPGDLKEQFIKVVHAGSCETVSKGSAIGTYGLGGCTAVHIDNQDTDILLHYFYADKEKIFQQVQKGATQEKTRKVSFFVMQETEKDPEGKWRPCADALEAKNDLQTSIAYLQARNIPYEFHQYGGEYLPVPDSGGQLLIDTHGKIFFSGKEVSDSQADETRTRLQRLNTQNRD